MVSKVLQLFKKEYSSLHQTAILLSVTQLVALVLGLVRDRLFAGMVGAGPVLDVYYAAFKIPDIVFSTAATLVSVSILIPYIQDLREADEGDTQKERGQVRTFIGRVLSWYGILIGMMSLVIFIFMPYIAKLIVPGFSPSMLESLVFQSRLLLISPCILGLSNIFSSVVQSYNRFFVYALAPVLYNVGIIIGILFFYPTFGVMGLAFGVILGACMHAVLQGISVYQLGIMPKISFPKWRERKEIFTIIIKSLPRTFALAIAQITMLILTSFASKLGSGSISLFQFAYILQSVPLMLLGVSYSVAAFPRLVLLKKEGNMKEFINTFLVPVRSIIFWSLPIISLVIVFRAYIVRIVFGANTFSWNDTKIVAAMLAVFSFSLLFQSLNQVLLRAYYALGESKKPLVRSVIDLIFTAGISYGILKSDAFLNKFGLLFTTFFKIPYSGKSLIIVLACAFTLGQCINFITLWVSFRKQYLRGLDLGLIDTVIQGIIGAGIGSFIAYGMLLNVGKFIQGTTWISLVLNTVLAGTSSIFVMCVYWYFAKNPEFHATFNAICSKFWKSSNTEKVSQGIEKTEIESSL